MLSDYSLTLAALLLVLLMLPYEGQRMSFRVHYNMQSRSKAVAIVFQVNIELFDILPLWFAYLQLDNYISVQGIVYSPAFFMNMKHEKYFYVSITLHSVLHVFPTSMNS
jgi:hypothetical protein